MTGEGAIEVVTRLFGAAHWQVGESDYAIWDEALSDIGDDEAMAAAAEMIALVIPKVSPYTPALLRQTVNMARSRARVRRTALPEDTSPEADPEARARGLAEVREALAKAKGPLGNSLRRTPFRTPNEPDFIEDAP